MAKSRLAKNMFALTIAELLNRGLGMVLAAYIARVFGPEVNGEITFAMTITTFFSVFVDFGLTQLGLREVAKNPQNATKIGNTILALQLSIAIILVIATLAIVPFTGLTSLAKQLTMLFSLTIIPIALNMSYMFQAFERMEYIAYGRTIGQVVVLSLTFAGLLYWNQPWVVPAGQAIGLTVASLLLIAWLIKLFSYKLHKVSRQDVQLMAKLSWPFFVSAVAVQIYFNIDVIILRWLTTSYDVGQYGAAYKLFTLVLLLGGILGSTFFPSVAANWSANKDQFAKSLSQWVRLSGVLGWPLAVGSAVVATQLVTLLNGHQFAPAGPYFAALMIIPLFIFINMPIGQSLIAIGREKDNTISTVIGAIVNIIANLILIPHYGVFGAIAATIMAEAAVFTYIYIAYRRHISQPILITYTLKPILASTIMAAAIWPIKDQPFYVVIPIAMIVYGLIMLAIKGVSLDELQLWKLKQSSQE